MPLPISNRSNGRSRYNGLDLTQLSLVKKQLNDINPDVIINCSIVGYQFPVFDNDLGYCLQPYTPLSKVDTTIRVKKGGNFLKRYIEGAQLEIEHNIHSSLSFLGHVQPHAIIFDIIYQPQQTMLLQLASCFGLSVQNGLAMNMEQAVLAFSRVIPEQSDPDVIRNIMQS